MKSKTSFFNCGLFKSNLKRFWPIFAAYFAVMIIALPMTAMTSGYDVDKAWLPMAVRNCVEYGPIVNFMSAIVVAMGVFGFMFSQRSCGMIASLPIKRGSVFATALASGIVPVLAINLITALITAIPLFSNPSVYAAKALIIWFAVNSMQYVFFFGLAAILAVITGSLVALPVFYLVFNFLAVGIETMLREIFTQFVFGFSNNGSSLLTEALSPVINLCDSDSFICKIVTDEFSSKLTSFSFNMWETNLVYFAVGCAFMAAALLIFRKRRMENCGDVIAIPALRGMFRYCVSICLALSTAVFFGSIFGNSGNTVIDGGLYIIYMVIGAFVGWFGSDMLLKKSFSVFRGNWVGFLIILALCAAFIAGCVFDVFDVGAAPSADSIESVTVDSGYGSNMIVTLKDSDSIDAVIDLTNSIIKNKDEHLNCDWDELWYTNFSYTLKNGHTVYREYPVRINSQDMNAFLEILKSDEAKAFITTPGVPVVPENVEYQCFYTYDILHDQPLSAELTPEQAVDFFLNAYTPDVMEGNCVPRNVVNENSNHANIEIQFVDASKGYYDGEMSMYYNCEITPECQHCIQWVKSNLGIDLNGILK